MIKNYKNAVMNINLQWFIINQDAKRAAALRSKFEKWEQSKDAQDQARQMMIHDENGEVLETAGNLKARFEMLQMQETTPPPLRSKKFVPKRFKVLFIKY